MEEYSRDVLVRTPNWVGDSVLSFPSLKAIAESAERVTVIAHPRTASLFGKLKWVDEVFSFKAKRELLQLSLKLRSHKFSTGIVFPFSFTSAGFIFLTGARERIGYSGGLRRIFLTKVLKLPKDYRDRHLALTYFELAKLVNPNARYSNPVLPVESAPPASLIIGVAPGATFGPAKRWRIDRFIELINRLVAHYGCKVYIFGGPREAPIEIQLKRPIRTMVEDFTGKTDILETAYHIAQCRIMITNDTGLMHLAAAVGTPVVALFGSTSPSWTGPLGQGHSIIRKNLPCSPCYRRRCPYGTYDCLNRITVEEVLDCVRKYL